MVTIEIKENSKQAKAFIALAKTLSFVKFKETAGKDHSKNQKEESVSKNIPNKATLQILEENDTAENSDLERYDDVKKLFKDLGI